MSRPLAPLVTLLLAFAAPDVPLAAGGADEPPATPAAPPSGDAAAPAGTAPSTQPPSSGAPSTQEPPSSAPSTKKLPPSGTPWAATPEPLEAAPAFAPPVFLPEEAPPPAPPTPVPGAAEKPATKLPPSPSQPGAAAAGPPSPFAPEDTWVDAGHAFVEEKVFAPLLRFDRFFSDERELEPERSRSFLRFRNEIRFRQDGPPEYGLSIRADLQLPGLAHWLDRFRLVITGESEDTTSALFPNDPTATPLRPTGNGHANAELRFGLWDGILSHVDLGAGVLMQIPPGVFTRVRLRAAVPVDAYFLTRYAVSGFWRSDTLFGTNASVELERPLSLTSLVRFGVGAEQTQRSKGIEWANDLSFLHTIGPRRVIVVGVGMEGATRSPAPNGLNRYRVYTRLRREVWRRWIFAEVEPEVGWPWDLEDKRHRVFAATFRLEVQFQGNERSAQFVEGLTGPPEPLPIDAPPLRPH